MRQLGHTPAADQLEIILRANRPGLLQKGIESGSSRRDIVPVTTTKADSQKRVKLPKAKPGQVYSVQQNPDGGFTLILIRTGKPTSPQCRVIKEDGFTVVAPKQPIDEGAIKELLADFP